jgi:hypothetical protein
MTRPSAGAAGWTTKVAQVSSTTVRSTFMEDQGAAWMAKELRARDSFHGGATTARELWLAGSYEAVALARGPR